MCRRTTWFCLTRATLAHTGLNIVALQITVAAAEGSFLSVTTNIFQILHPISFHDNLFQRIKSLLIGGSEEVFCSFVI